MRNPRAVRQWLKKAAEDLTVARLAAEGKVRIPWVACFHAQQSAEKFLKAFLISANIAPEKTHDLLRLLKECVHLDSSLVVLEVYCELLNPYSVEIRYPEEIPVTLSDAKKAIKGAEQVKKVVISKIH